MFYPSEFVYNSQWLDGSSLSLPLTQELLADVPEFMAQIQDVIKYDKKVELDILEATDHYREFVRQLKEGPQPMNSTRLCEIHRGMFRSTNERAGQIRDCDIPEYETEMIYPHYKFMPYLVEGYDLWIANTSLTGLELALEIHRRVIDIHPFAEGNGRVARAALNIVLNEARLQMFDIKAKWDKEYTYALVTGSSVEWLRSRYSESVIVI